MGKPQRTGQDAVYSTAYRKEKKWERAMLWQLREETAASKTKGGVANTARCYLRC